jgi:hypothetical protein
LTLMLASCDRHTYIFSCFNRHTDIVKLLLAREDIQVNLQAKV